MCSCQRAFRVIPRPQCRSVRARRV
jgi:hypothetical protein